MILGSPLPSTTSGPVTQPQPSPRATSSSIETEDTYRSTSKSPRPSFRVAKAIGLYPQTNTAVVLDRQPTVTTVTSAPLERGGTVEASIRETVELSLRGNISNVEPLGTTAAQQRAAENIERIRNSTAKKDSKITWILTTNKSGGRPKYDQEERNRSSSSGPVGRNVSFEEVEDLTVLPLREEMSKADLMLNKTRSSLVTSLSAAGSAGNAAIRTFNRSEDDVEIDEEEEVAQTQHFATAASILEGEQPIRCKRIHANSISRNISRLGLTLYSNQRRLSRY